MSMVLFPLLHTQSFGCQPKDMEERNLIQTHRIRWYRFPAAPLNARYPQTAISRLRPFGHFLPGEAVTLSFPLSGRWALSPSFSLCVSKCPTDDLRTLRASTSFLLRKARLFALHHPKPKPKPKLPMDDGELAAVGATAFRKQCLLWCLVRRACRKNCMLSAPKQRLVF